MNKNGLVLGVDIGGSKINMVLWNAKKVLKIWRAQSATLTNLKKGVEFFSRPNDPQGVVDFKIGVAVPGLVDETTGTILRCPNLPAFNNLNLKKELKQNVRISNDTKCFLKAETEVGAGKGYKDILGVIFGTGIGGAINGFQGKDGWAGEFGHMVIDKGKSWEKLYQTTKQKPKEQEKINAIGFANLINIFNPEIIILGGKGARLLFGEGAELLSGRLLLPKRQMPKIVESKLGGNAVAIGAAMLWK
ncbi:MAG: ROK family protein [Candidatus Pacebacteria bacterium]|nr:ROK family protein [Candidatus Paceibacterota bacterium]